MRKNIFTLFVLAVFFSGSLASCSKKAVVTPKQTNQSNLSSKTGVTGSTTTTASTPGSSTHTCGGGSSHTGG